MPAQSEAAPRDSAPPIPAAWQQEFPDLRFFVFNPAILRWGDGYLLVYRVVAPGYRMQRLALCRLDADLHVIPGSLVPLSDQLGDQGNHIGDPRLIRFRDTVWLCYCDLTAPTTLYWVALTPDPWRVADTPRPLILSGPRQWQEKNWMPFVHDDRLLAVYTIAPHVILDMDLARDDVILCRRIYTTAWDAAPYVHRFGELRGGAPPVQVGDRFYSFFHSSRFAPGLYPLYRRLRQQTRAWINPPADVDWFIDPRPTQPLPPSSPPPRLQRTRMGHLLQPLSRWLDRYWARLRYYGGCYTFAATPPYAPQSWMPEPLLWPLRQPPPQRRDERLRALNDRVIFPAGAVYLPDVHIDAPPDLPGGEWVISYGLHDERCMIHRVAHAELVTKLQPIPSPLEVTPPSVYPGN